MDSVSLKVVVVYSESSGAKIGSRACRQLRTNLGNRFEVSQSVWNAELFKSPKLRALAAREAMEAHVVFVAMAEGTPIDPDLAAWLELWEKRGRSGRASLVALLKRNTTDEPHVVAEALHNFAKRARMDFFCHSEVQKRRSTEIVGAGLATLC